jgi:hypothetical protein
MVVTFVIQLGGSPAFLVVAAAEEYFQVSVARNQQEGYSLIIEVEVAVLVVVAVDIG